MLHSARIPVTMHRWRCQLSQSIRCCPDVKALIIDGTIEAYSGACTSPTVAERQGEDTALGPQE